VNNPILACYHALNCGINGLNLDQGNSNNESGMVKLDLSGLSKTKTAYRLNYGFIMEISSYNGQIMDLTLLLSFF